MGAIAALERPDQPRIAGLNRRDDTRRHAGHQRRDYRENEGPSGECSASPLHGGKKHVSQRPTRPPGEDQPDRSSDGSQKHRFTHELSGQSASSHAECESHRRFAPAPQRADEQEVGDVGTGDQKNDRGHAGESARDGKLTRVELRIGRATKRRERSESGGVVYHLTRTQRGGGSRRHGVQLRRPRTVRKYVHEESVWLLVPVGGATRSPRHRIEREPDLRRIQARALESGGRDADHRVVMRTEAQRVTECVVAPVEVLEPQVVTYHGYGSEPAGDCSSPSKKRPPSGPSLSTRK